MSSTGIEKLLANNQNWATKITKETPDFFSNLAKQQSPAYLWIGCSDSRVPANQIVGLLPGEVFVHRNVANLVVHTDLNLLSVLQFAVEVLKVRHIIVCGHYGCGGVKAAAENKPHGLIDNWLRHIKDIYAENQRELTAISDQERRLDRLAELNVMAQVSHVANTTIVQDAWRSKRQIEVHGLIYSISDGILRDLKVGISSQEQLNEVYKLK